MINPKEAVVLAGLRETTLAYLSESDFKEVEKAVERDGILSLQGSFAAIVKGAVAKHGSHNQSSHGRKGGGKGGGGGAASSSPSSTSPQADKDRSGTSRVLTEDMDEAQQALDDLSMRTENKQDALQVDRASKHIAGAKQDFSDARNLTGKKQTAKMQSGVDKVVAAANQLSISDDKRIEDVTAGIISAVQETFGDADSAFRDLGVDVDDFFGP